MHIAKLAAAAVVTAALCAGADVSAQTAPAPAASPRLAGATLAIPELIERLSREGYRDVGEVERKSDRLYKVDARDARGRMLELYVDARTAEILASEEDDDD